MSNKKKHRNRARRLIALSNPKPESWIEKKWNLIEGAQADFISVDEAHIFNDAGVEWQKALDQVDARMKRFILNSKFGKYSK